MTPTTEAKAAAIRVALLDQNPVPGGLSTLLALLTSTNKDEREQGKRTVRELTKIGSDILAAEQTAQALAGFANKHDPDEIAP